MTPQEEFYDCSNGSEQVLDDKALFGLSRRFQIFGSYLYFLVF